jgi:hypothetical protein
LVFSDVMVYVYECVFLLWGMDLLFAVLCCAVLCCAVLCCAVLVPLLLFGLFFPSGVHSVDPRGVGAGI